MSDLVGRVDQASFCVEIAVSILDPCLGQASGDAVRLVSSVLEFVARIVQEGKFLFGPVSEQFFKIWGKQTYDTIGGPSHVIGTTSPNFFTHADPGTQTGLVCFIGNVLGGTTCAKSAADLVSAGGQTVGVLILVANQIVSLDYSDINFVGNPASDDNRPELINIITSIMTIIPDRLVLDLDYLGHFIYCIPGLQSLGTALQILAALVDNLLDDIIEFLIVTLLLVYQVIIWFISVLGASPFDGETSGDELIIMFSIFKDWFLTIVDIITSWLTGLIDYTIFPKFSEVFGQNSLLATNPGTARFTGCFTDVEDCLCGLSKVSIGKICFGQLGCLSDLWPDCGDYEPPDTTDRRRSYGPLNANQTVWSIYANNFGDTVCGPVFKYWNEHPPGRDQSIGEANGNELFTCVQMVIDAGGSAETMGLPDSSYLLDPDRLTKTAHGIASGLPVLASVAWSNTMLMFADPPSINGRPSASQEYFDYETVLRKNGIVDPVALKTMNSTVEAYRRLANYTTDYLFSDMNEAVKEADVKLNTKLLALHLADWMSSGLGLGMSLLYETRRSGLASTLYQAGKEATSGYFERTFSVAGAQSQAEFRRRSVYPYNRPIGPRLRPEVPVNETELMGNRTQLVERLSNAMWPVDITPAVSLSYKKDVTLAALGEYKAHFMGGETLMPRYSEFGELISPEGTIPLSCTTVLTNCSANFSACIGQPLNGCIQPNTTVCTGEEFLIPHFDVCSNFLGAAIVAGDCTEQATVIDFYNTLAQCQAHANDQPGTDPVTLVITENFYNCFATGGALGTLCLVGSGCTDCPIEQVIPGFQCQLLDNTRYHMEHHFQHCMEKLELGPGKPELPTNITAWNYSAFDNLRLNISKLNRCGNGVVEPNQPVLYKNPITKVLYNFSGEQCDPPLTVYVNATTNETLFCGPACQIAVCGNGVIDPGEQCDDGNLRNGDTCSSTCRAVVCGNGVIDAGEDCDDGNTLDYDGCSAQCKAEICPDIRYTSQILNTGSTYNGCNGTTLQGLSPRYCFNLEGAHSVEVICTARIPVVWAHSDTECWSPPRAYQMKKNCSDMPAICVGNLYASDPTNCNNAVQVGLDFTCGRNCSVCGNNITEPSEDCDDGTLFPTGIPSEDECLFCRKVCTCHSDPRVACSGVCGGGPSSGGACDPRNPSVCQGAICLPISCCGDGTLQAGEDCDVGPGTFNTSCFNCQSIPNFCTCVPGRPCMGLCWGKTRTGTFVPTGQSGSGGMGAPFFNAISALNVNQAVPGAFGMPCDVNQDPFACPGEGQICVPFECCGDGVHTTPQFCDGEPGCTFTCNMTDAFTGLITYITDNPYRSDVPAVIKVQLYSYRDRCTGIQPPGTNGVCDSTTNRACAVTGIQFPGAIGITCNSTLFNEAVIPNPCGPFPASPMPSVPLGDVFAQSQIGLCYDQYGFAIRPAVLCDRTNFATCAHLGIADSYCVAQACCADGLINGLANLDATSNIALDAYGTGGFDDTCGLEIAVPSLDACKCQAGLPCAGVCTYASVATDILCDAGNSSRSPWCPVGGPDPFYDCVPIFCCGDGILQASRPGLAPYASTFLLGNGDMTDPTFGYNRDSFSFGAITDGGWEDFWRPLGWYENSNLSMSLYTIPLLPTTTGETDDTDFNASCGLLTTVSFDNNALWTQCEPAPSFDGIWLPPVQGFCADPNTGHFDLTFGPCDYYAPVCTTDYPQCIPMICCGDGILQFSGSECDVAFYGLGPCTSTCNISTSNPYVHPVMRRKRQQPLHEYVVLEDTNANQQLQTTLGVVESALDLDALNISDLFDDSFSLFMMNASDIIGNQAGLVPGTLNATFDKIIQFFTDFETDPYIPMKQKSFWGWLRFEVSCLPGLHTTGQLGVGIIQAIDDLIKPFIIFFVVVGVSTAQIGGIPAQILLWLAGMLGITIFMGYAFGFPWPYCLPLWPENFFTELVELAKLGNTTFPKAFENLTLTADPETCVITYKDCRSLGLYNGLDYLFVQLQDWFPDFMLDFYNSPVVTLYSMLPTIGDSLARTRYVPNPIPDDVDTCTDLFWLALFSQVVWILTLVFLVGTQFWSLLAGYFGYLVLWGSSFADAFAVLYDQSEDTVFM